MYRIIFVLAIALIIAGCSKQQPTSETVVELVEIAEETDAKSDTSVLTPDIPPDVRYTIVDSDTVPSVKRTLSVRLNKKVSEDTLRSIALKLKSEDSSRYDRTLITYYLPGMTVGTSAWATTHFDPDLEVHVLGTTVEKANANRPRSQPHDRKIIGKWLDEGFLGGTYMTIFVKGGGCYLEMRFDDGSSDTIKLIKRNAQRFDNPESDAGDHFVILPSGDLEISDNDCLISTASKID